MASFSSVIVDTPTSVAVVPDKRNLEKITLIEGAAEPIPLLRRASSLDSDAYFPVKAVHRTTTAEDEEDRVETFEGWKARTSATVLQISWMAMMTRAAYVNSTHWKDWVGCMAWYASLWSVPQWFVHKERTPWNTLAFFASLFPLLAQPHMEISRKVSYIGAIHGSASVIVTSRALQYWFNQEEFKGWKAWRRMFFVSAWGWHDFRQIKYVGTTKLRAELERMAKWGSILAATVAFHVWWGKPADLGNYKSAFTYKVLKFFFFRWAVGFWTLLAWFNVMDTFPRALHFWADGHELRHISEDPWGARTLKDFWGRRWNVPVQDMLVQGVFRPISKAKWLPMRKTIAKLSVFVVSALGHTYAISCGGSPWSHLRSMFAFFMAQIPMLALEDTFKMEGLGWMLAAELPLAPLFIEPCLTFVHL